MASKRKESLDSWIVKKQRLDPSWSPPGRPPTAAPTTGTQKRDAHRISGFNQEWSKEYSWLKEVDGDCERGFSAMKRIKTEQRNRLIDITLNNLMMITLEGPSCQDMEAHLQEVADKWGKVKKQRIKF
ncbi:hypothetical protein CAPTEDRAFT_211489 [Capitella teleta]|uniref:Uncharacterized protein n=1 Tax=Capitella teleta TaxID=283909 RepID=R7UBU9_CAPTE|nr:hypothetical protein CAPTEDRAFT_211489 [Capitella teleta]|eukprot:ELU03434.1 hypothetical protein CAPTEDRAFT_211489 [Capitella teleta]